MDSVTVIIEKGLDGWWVSQVAEVPGAISQGRTPEEARTMALEAMDAVIEANRELALSRAENAVVEKVLLPR